MFEGKKMILPKYVAVQAYLESSGTAFAELRYVEPLLEKMLEVDELSAAMGKEILGHKSDVAKTIYNLFQHIGIIKARFDPETTTDYFSLTNFSKYLLETRTDNQNLVQPLIPFFLTWLPLKIFLKYLQENPGADLNRLRSTLGEQLLYHTKETAQLFKGVSFRGGRRPFNEMNVENVLCKIGGYLGLTYKEKRFGPYYLTPLGKYVTNSIDMLNFQFKNLDRNLDPIKLAILDFVSQGAKNLIVFSNKEEGNKIREFVSFLETNTNYRVHINYNLSNFNAILSTNSAFWAFANIFSNVTYDQIKVLEFNTKILEYIEM